MYIVTHYFSSLSSSPTIPGRIDRKSPGNSSIVFYQKQLLLVFPIGFPNKKQLRLLILSNHFIFGLLLSLLLVGSAWIISTTIISCDILITHLLHWSYDMTSQCREVTGWPGGTLWSPSYINCQVTSLSFGGNPF